jgi:hypothetical protein
VERQTDGLSNSESGKRIFSLGEPEDIYSQVVVIPATECGGILPVIFKQGYRIESRAGSICCLRSPASALCGAEPRQLIPRRVLLGVDLIEPQGQSGFVAEYRSG